MRRASRPVRRTEPLRHDALTAEPARLAKHDCAVLVETLIEDETMPRRAQKVREQFLSLFDWLPPQVSPVEFKQIERAMFGISDCAVAADQIKDREPVLIKPARVRSRNDMALL
jgi:hypothetical protein